MRLTVYFEDSENTYEVDFMKLLKRLKLTEDQVKQAVQDMLSKS